MVQHIHPECNNAINGHEQEHDEGSHDQDDDVVVEAVTPVMQEEVVSPVNGGQLRRQRPEAYHLPRAEPHPLPCTGAEAAASSKLGSRNHHQALRSGLGKPRTTPFTQRL